MKSSVNFRDEFDEFMKDYGYPILLQRIGGKLRCRCWNEKYQEADSRCPICVGTGWVSRMERHTVRDKSAGQAMQRMGLGQQTEIGKIWIDAKTIYMSHDTHPKVGDYVYEVGWTNAQKPSHLIHTYRVNDIIAVRGDNGRIEYWSVSVKSETTNLSFQDIVVRSIGPIQNYEMVKR